MRKSFLFAAAAMLAASQAQGATKVKVAKTDSVKTVALQEVQVFSTRAGKKTPMAYTNIGKQELKQANFGKDVPFLLALTPSVTLTSDAGNEIGRASCRERV